MLNLIFLVNSDFQFYLKQSNTGRLSFYIDDYLQNVGNIPDDVRDVFIKAQKYLRGVTESISRSDDQKNRVDIVCSSSEWCEFEPF